MNEVFFRKIERLKEEVLYLKVNKERFLKNLSDSNDIKKIVERSIYLCAEITLDIEDIVIIIKGLPKPPTYSDAIYKLGNYKIIPENFARRFVYVAGLRNFLAHDYQIDTTNEMKKFLKSWIRDVEKYIDYIEKI